MEQQTNPSITTCLPSKIDALLSSSPNRVKIPTQISPLHAAAVASLSSSSAPTLSPQKPLYKSFQNTHPPTPLRNITEPSDAAGIFRTSIVWFRRDLRLNDNECLNEANNQSMSVLPIFCFDAADYEGRGHYDRAIFIIQSVSDLKKNLQAKGSDLVVRIGKPESVLFQLAKTVGAEAIYANREFTNEEIKAEDDIDEILMKDEGGVQVKYFWGNTLYHADDFPFKLRNFPTTYSKFKKIVVEDLDVRKPIAPLKRLKGLPPNVEPGEIPSMLDLGFDPSSSPLVKIMVDSRQKQLADGCTDFIQGGETKAIHGLKKLAAEFRVGPLRKIDMSSWLLWGCLSPRSVFYELMESARSISDADTALSNCFQRYIKHLLGNDFMGFSYRQHHSAKQWKAAKLSRKQRMEHFSLSGSLSNS